MYEAFLYRALLRCHERIIDQQARVIRSIGTGEHRTQSETLATFEQSYRVFRTLWEHSLRR
jgi:hypothetical protein